MILELRCAVSGVSVRPSVADDSPLGSGLVALGVHLPHQLFGNWTRKTCVHFQFQVFLDIYIKHVICITIESNHNLRRSLFWNSVHDDVFTYVHDFRKNF